MYTHEDYVRDLYTREHGRGYEQSMADLRACDYEHGQDPELRYTSEGRKILKQQSKEEWSMLLGGIVVTIIPLICGIAAGIIMNSFIVGVIFWIATFWACFTIWEKIDE